MNHIVLLKSGASQRGGLEKSSSRIAAAFVAKGARVSILTTGTPPPDQPQISFYATKTSKWPAFLRMEQFDRFVQNWLKKNPADLVFGMDRNREQTHYRAGNGVHDAYLKSRLFTEGKFKVFTCRLNPMHRKIMQLERSAFENPRLKKLFTNSRMVRDQVLERYSIERSKIEVVHNGVEWHEMEGDFQRWPEERGAILKRLNLDPNVFHFLFIGNGYLRKGLGQLLQGLSRLKSRDFHLSVIGKENKIEKYVSQARRLGLSKHVRFFGPQNEMRPFYQASDALALPSFYDPFANVTVEALAMGLHVLSSRSNGGFEVLTEETGTIFEDLLDPDAMAQGLQKALQKPKTWESSLKNRLSVQKLDFSQQMNRLTEACLG
ncbi:MAG: glycosyltransferase family 4 protein [Verrucomicrobia bacterium]|nr:glycosyltransferase family 4 protein [Verrucomicrobiota bacterium]